MRSCAAAWACFICPPASKCAGAHVAGSSGGRDDPGSRFRPILDRPGHHRVIRRDRFNRLSGSAGSVPRSMVRPVRPGSPSFAFSSQVEVLSDHALPSWISPGPHRGSAGGWWGCRRHRCGPGWRGGRRGPLDGGSLHERPAEAADGTQGLIPARCWGGWPSSAAWHGIASTRDNGFGASIRDGGAAVAR